MTAESVYMFVLGSAFVAAAFAVFGITVSRKVLKKRDRSLHDTHWFI